MNALTNAEVGKYLNDHFVASFQKVGTFRLENGQKQGGNVASYFCLADGSVLHAVAGPVDAATLLREARWVVETRKLARTLSRGDYGKYQGIFRKAHVERLRQEHRLNVDFLELADEETLAALPVQAAGKRSPRKALGQQERVHLLLAANSLAKLDRVYPVVFEKILGEKLSTLPVQEK